MSSLRRIVLLRHGNTVGNSHERFHGSADHELSDEGRAQVLAASKTLAQEVFDLVVASPQRRSWQSAALVAAGHSVRLIPEFREIDFGRWEGLTAEEIEARDPSLYQQWRENPGTFDFPGGEPRAEFRERIGKGFAALEQSGAKNVLAVIHKGVIRTLAAELTGTPLELGIPELGNAVSFTRDGDTWVAGRRSSNPEPLR